MTKDSAYVLITHEKALCHLTCRAVGRAHVCMCVCFFDDPLRNLLEYGTWNS